MKNEKYRGRVHALLLYPDDESHVKAMQIIEKNMDYASILHDSDFTEDGEIKKAHWHIILRFKNATWSSAVCKDLGIEENYIEQVRNLDNALMYLMHYNDKDKYQYDFDCVKGTMKDRLSQALNNVNKSEGEKIVELIDYIKDYKGILSITDFATFCASNGYWSEFRRSGSIFIKMIEEHNNRVGARKKA